MRPFDQGREGRADKLLMAGAAESLMAYNMPFIAKSIDRRLVCVPLEGKAITGSEVWAAAERALTGPHEFSSVIAAAVSVLADKYPAPPGQLMSRPT